MGAPAAHRPACRVRAHPALDEKARFPKPRGPASWRDRDLALRSCLRKRRKAAENEGPPGDLSRGGFERKGCVSRWLSVAARCCWAGSGLALPWRPDRARALRKMTGSFKPAAGRISRQAAERSTSTRAYTQLT